MKVWGFLLQGMSLIVYLKCVRSASHLSIWVITTCSGHSAKAKRVELVTSQVNQTESGRRHTLDIQMGGIIDF